MLSRRTLLKTIGPGFGYLAFAALAHEQAARANDPIVNPLAPKKTHFTPRAKRVIFLCMEGAPSHIDTFDHKPRLTDDDGKPAPRGQGGFRGGKLFGSPFQFAQHGASGLWISELFPEVAKHADKLCVLNGMHTDLPNYAQAFLQMHCGIFQFPRPSLGAWVLYGLGTTNENLPGFITINPPQSNGGAANYAASFPPAVYQGTRIGRGQCWIGRAGPQSAESPPNSERITCAARLCAGVESFHRGITRRGFRNRRLDRVLRAGLPNAGRDAAGVGSQQGDRRDAQSLRHRGAARWKWRPERVWRWFRCSGGWFESIRLAMSSRPTVDRGGCSVRRGDDGRLGSRSAPTCWWRSSNATESGPQLVPDFANSQPHTFRENPCHSGPDSQNNT